MKVVRLPACALREPRPRSCVVRPTVVPSVNDIKAGTLTAEVQAAPAGAAQAEVRVPAAGGDRKPDLAKAAQAALAAQLAAGSVFLLASELLNDGFTQGLTKNKKGYLFRNAAGEEVRIMRRNGAWDIRIRNYLAENGDVAPPNSAHQITAKSY
ncbi:hypothetical protein FXF51_45130 [Nonomuraea sp. PA05]|uniref:hypothetical protein n=1 Tax=Nonomuraea sp. PA05 TaxID=2604466 RepID=UPI0011D45026|nr:hypothetical protein [Nonomuraea sp. PA05]TYB56006.1 hypothetical protein FXF51_45130 [Nonomuraea sp. PA05]